MSYSRTGALAAMRFPISIRNSHKLQGSLLIQEVDYEPALLNAPFIIDYLHAKGVWAGKYNYSRIIPVFDRGKVHETPLDRWLDEVPFSTAPVGFVFHTSRCGSTLFCQAAKCCRKLHVLSEPPIINAVLDVELDMQWQDRLHLLQKAIGVMAACGASSTELTLIKTRSWNVLWLKLFENAFPDTKAIFMYRDLIEIVSSIQKAPPGWLRGLEVFASFLGVPSKDIEDLKHAPLFAKCEFMVENFRQSARGSSGLINQWLAYNDIKDKFFEVLGGIWGIELAIEERLCVTDSFKFYSKSYPARIPFK